MNVKERLLWGFEVELGSLETAIYLNENEEGKV